jgi:hypothetical protein
VRGVVVALRDVNGTTLVLLSADLYMLFANDLAVYHSLLRAAVGEETYAGLRFLLASTHNHHVRKRQWERKNERERETDGAQTA